MSPDNAQENVSSPRMACSIADVTALRSFLHLVSYYWMYIPRCADVAALLDHHTQEGVPYFWELSVSRPSSV